VGASGWLLDNFSTSLSSVGIIASLLFTSFSVRAQTRSRRLSNLFSLTKAHREIWFQLYSEPALSRILQVEIDLEKDPPTVQEEVFVTSLLLHLNCIHHAASLGMFPELEGMRMDIREFYSLPIPQEIWKRLKPLQDLKFITFIENCVHRR